MMMLILTGNFGKEPRSLTETLILLPEQQGKQYKFGNGVGEGFGVHNTLNRNDRRRLISLHHVYITIHCYQELHLLRMMLPHQEQTFAGKIVVTLVITTFDWEVKSKRCEYILFDFSSIIIPTLLMLCYLLVFTHQRKRHCDVKNIIQVTLVKCLKDTISPIY